MPPATLANFNAIVHDLKHSNYFRVWALLWFVTFILFWVGFGTYVGHVGANSNLYAAGFKSEGQVAYPQFHMRLEGGASGPLAIPINSISCLTNWNRSSGGGAPLKPQYCLGYTPWTANTTMTNCFAVPTAGLSATTYTGNGSQPGDLFAPAHWSSFIWCNVTINTTLLGSTPDWVAWELEGPTNFAFGDNAYTSIWFGPFEQTQVMLNKFVIDGTTYWERNNVYLPTFQNFNNSMPGLSTILTSTAMETTTVATYQQFSVAYRSWNALADAGGFAFSLFIMLTVALVILGLFMENDSTFLKGSHHYHDADAAAGNGKPTERTGLVY